MKAAPPLHYQTQSTVASSTIPAQNLLNRDNSTKAASTPSTSVTTTQFDERSFFKAQTVQFHHTPANVTSQLASIRDLLHCIDDLQSRMIDQLEVSFQRMVKMQDLYVTPKRTCPRMFTILFYSNSN